jgi:hypothetical protein
MQVTWSPRARLLDLSQVTWPFFANAGVATQVTWICPRSASSNPGHLPQPSPSTTLHLFFREGVHFFHNPPSTPPDPTACAAITRCRSKGLGHVYIYEWINRFDFE